VSGALDRLSALDGLSAVNRLSALDVLPEHSLAAVVDSLVRVVEAVGAAVIFVGAVLAAVRFVATALRTRSADAFVPVRLSLGRFLELGLEFQLASDVLRTAIAPSYREIGQLGAIAAIRTALNYFLAREIRDERRQLAGEAARPPSGMPPSGNPLSGNPPAGHPAPEDPAAAAAPRSGT